MEENQNPTGQERGQGSGLFEALPPDVALKTLSNLQLEDSRIMAPLKNRSRLANQVYDLLQSFLTGARAGQDVYYPSLEDIYGDLQMHKRSISDKTPMPSEAELLRTVCLMSVQSPPFLHILREIPTNATNPERFLTRLVAPTEKHRDKVAVAYKATTRNNLVQIKSMMKQLDPEIPGGAALNRIQDANPRAGRVETILGHMFFGSMSGDSFSNEDGAEAQNDEMTLKRVNQALRVRLFRPLILDLLREKIIFSLSCQDIRSQTGLKIPDVVLFNNLENVKHRFSRLCEILTHEAVMSILDEDARTQVQKFAQGGLLQDGAEAAAHNLLEKAGTNGAPLVFLETAAELVRLREWYDEQSRAHKQDKQKQDIQEIIERLKKQGGIFRAKNGRKINIDEKYLNLFLNESGPVLVAADPPLPRNGKRNAADYETIYLLYKDRAVTGKAIETALEAYNKVSDPFLIRLLEDLLQLNQVPDSKLKEYVPPAYMEQLREAIRDSYKSYLSPLERLWMSLTGKTITDEKIRKIQQRLEYERVGKEKIREEKRNEALSKQARKKVKSLARDRTAEREAVAEEQSRSGPSSGFDQEAQQVLDYLLTQINLMWDKNFYPDREQVLRLIRSNDKEVAEKVIGLVDAGAQSTASIVRIPVPGKGHIYGGREYLISGKQELIEKFKRKQDQGSAVQVSGGATIQLSGKEEDRMFFRAMLHYLNNLPDA